MTTRIYILVPVFILFIFPAHGQQQFALVINGGAGLMASTEMVDALQANYWKKPKEALLMGERMLKKGSTSSDIVAAYKGLNVTEACREEIKKLGILAGTGGVIALDSRGKVAMEFNTSCMFKGYIKSAGEKEIAIFAHD